jgi:hypothetical protein
MLDRLGVRDYHDSDPRNLLAKYSDSQPRDDQGRFSAGATDDSKITYASGGANGVTVTSFGDSVQIRHGANGGGMVTLSHDDFDQLISAFADQRKP